MNQWKFHNVLTLFRLITVLKFHNAHEKQVHVVQLSCPSSRKDTDVLHLQILVIIVVNLI